MSNPYITGSKLAPEEVRQCVWNLVWFLPYVQIFKEVGRTPQALRPVLMRIERRMYFELDAWPFFHMVEFEKHNLNREFRPYVNHVEEVIEFVRRVPRAPGTKMKIVEEPIGFQGVLDCLFECPQHLPPRQFVTRYGTANPLQNTTPKGPYEDECWNRIRRKAHCLKCKSRLTPMWASKNGYIFRYAMEYAAERGKPRSQHTDIFIARMAYHLVWRAYELNLRAWHIQRQLLSRFQARGMDREQGEAHYQNGLRGDKERMEDLHAEVKRHLARLVLNDLTKSPIRIDRRKARQS